MHDNTSEFIKFARRQMEERGEQIRKWADSDNNAILKKCAQEVIEAAAMHPK
jgi:vacuolar-type H+-ATPase subunit H